MEKMGDLEREIQEMREIYRVGQPRDASWRKSQLQGLLKLVKENQNEMFLALHQDLGKHQTEAFRDEVGTLIKSLNLALSSLEQWMSGRKVKLPLLALLTTAEIVPDPLGLVLIISSWNFPLGLSLEPLIGALAAGNVVVLKPSELAPACSSFLANTIPKYVDSKAVKVIEGDAAVCEHLLQQRWDKIFFTGNGRVGRIVMGAAAKHLTPVTLELGGKCPAVVDSLSWSWDVQATVKRIIMAKFGSCAGQACIAIDYILAEKNFVSTLVDLMKEMMPKMYGEYQNERKSIARILNKQHFLRIKNLLMDPAVESSIVCGGFMDEDNLFIEPTILVDPPLGSAIMADEIFGPLLPIITLKKIEDSIEFINSRPKPLAIYAFTKNKILQKRMISETSSGSVVLNDAIVQYAVDALPFGGVGESGMGRYHGKFSFDTFSHEKAVVNRSFFSDLWFRYPPWNHHKHQLLNAAYNYDYLGIVLLVLGLKRSKHSDDNY